MNESQTNGVSTASPSPVQIAPPKPAKKPSPARKVILMFVGVFCALFFFKYAIFQFFHETTDNAYVTGHIHYIAPQVTGVVKTVAVENNDRVKAGDLLVQIDPEPFDAQLADAAAKFERAKGDYLREVELEKTRVVSAQDFAHAKNDFESAAAQLHTAQLNRKYTTIISPVDGVVGGRSVEVGNTVMPMINTLAIVEGHPWVEANYKETQVGQIRVGQKASLKIDAISGKTFTGRVVSIAPASGRQFALLPADNATGNFTKIVQRIPVRIEFDPESVRGYEDRIVPGLSVVASVRIR
jgi:membrane fusion protein, multidrug efflux system